LDQDPQLWQARNVGEHAYCPRLFYYMQVEGVFLPSADTEQGQHVHRRVDKPSATTSRATQRAEAAEPDETPQPPQTPATDSPRPVRSLHLTSERLSLTARLDLAEIAEPATPGGQATAVPIEYRKGRPRRVAIGGADQREADLPEEEEPGQATLHRAEPWPTDRVQVGLQVLLLEEHGYTVPRAILYYAAERRRLELPVDDGLRERALAELRAAQRTAAGPRPPPLVADPRCPRCSLQPVCLPDEVNHQRLLGVTVEGVPRERPPTGPEADRLAPRRIWPPRDDGIQLVAQREGVRLGVSGRALRFSDRDGRVVRDLPLAGIESLAVVGNVQVTTQALHTLAAHDVPVAFMTAAGRTVAAIDPLGPVSAAVRAAQVRRLDETPSRLAFARALVAAKITNQRTLLLRNASGVPRSVTDDMAEQARCAGQAATIDALLGHEGVAARLYFQWFAAMLADETLRDRFQATGRRRRPPPDPVNAVLSFGYAMLVHECVTALRLASLDPAQGGFHRPRPGKPALALDLMEPFRPLIADSVALALFNRGELRPGHFLDTAAGCAMTDHGRKAFFGAWGRRMATVVSHPVFEYRLEYRRMLTLHARLIAAWLVRDVPSLAFLTTR